MNLKQLMSYWQLKGMVSEKRILYSAQMYDNQEQNHTIRTAKISKSLDHAIIIYSSDGDNLRLINADIFFSALSSNIPERVFIKNANLGHLKENML